MVLYVPVEREKETERLPSLFLGFAIEKRQEEKDRHR